MDRQEQCKVAPTILGGNKSMQKSNIKQNLTSSLPLILILKCREGLDCPRERRVFVYTLNKVTICKYWMSIMVYTFCYFFGTNICLDTTYINCKASYLDRLQTTCKTIRGELTNMLLYRFWMPCNLYKEKKQHTNNIWVINYFNATKNNL